MLPIGLLMREHRLIERMVGNIQRELHNVTYEMRMDPIFIDQAVDFFRTYGDKTHHGKEENILFRELMTKSLKPEDQRTMEGLIAEHASMRFAVSSLQESKNRYLMGEAKAFGEVKTRLMELVMAYPPHIEKEDKHFFYPSMDYFTPEEQERMLQEFYEYDREMIHEKYSNVVDIIKSQTAGSSLMRCSVCGYIYDPQRGDPEHGVVSGTTFDELPDGWTCPVCFAPKKMFVKY